MHGKDEAVDDGLSKRDSALQQRFRRLENDMINSSVSKYRSLGVQIGFPVLTLLLYRQVSALPPPGCVIVSRSPHIANLRN